jgi:hypothetical protein
MTCAAPSQLLQNSLALYRQSCFHALSDDLFIAMSKIGDPLLQLSRQVESRRFIGRPLEMTYLCL